MEIGDFENEVEYAPLSSTNMADPSLKILFCSFSVVPDATGLSTRISEFIRLLQGRAIVDGLTVKPADRAHIERYFGARLMRVPVGAGDLKERIQAFERAVQRQVTSDDYAVIHTTDPYAGDLLARLRLESDFKLVYDVCGLPSVEIRYTDPHLEGDRKFMLELRRREQATLQAADAVIAPSTVTRGYLIKQGVDGDKITVVPPTIDVKHFQPAAQARPDRIPMRLLYLGSQASWQGLPTLLFALRDALKQPEAIGVRLSIVGPAHPEWRSELEEQVKGRGLADNVEFIDAVSREDLPRIIGQHDVGVAPLEKSDRNVDQGGLVTKIVEYAASGRPILTSDLPLTRGLVDDSCARFFPAGREKDLGKLIVELAANPAKRVQMGQAAHRLAEERFEGERQAETLLAFYEKLASTVVTGVILEGEDSSDLPTAVGALAEPPLPETGKVAGPKTTPVTAIPDIAPITDPALVPKPTPGEIPLPLAARTTDEVPVVAPPSARTTEEVPVVAPAIVAPRVVAPPVVVPKPDAAAAPAPPPKPIAAPAPPPKPIAPTPAPAPKPVAPAPVVAASVVPKPPPVAPAPKPVVAAPPVLAPPVAPKPVIAAPPVLAPTVAPKQVIAAPPVLAPPVVPKAVVQPPLVLAAPVAPKPPPIVGPPPMPKSAAVMGPPPMPKAAPASVVVEHMMPPLKPASSIAAPITSKISAINAPAPSASLVPSKPGPSKPGAAVVRPKTGEPMLLEEGEFESLSEPAALGPALLDAADLLEMPFTLPAEPTPPVVVAAPSGPDRNSVASGESPWLRGALLGFSPMGQLHMPNYVGTVGPLIPVAESVKLSP